MKINKINQLVDGKLLFAFWANNRGRGSDNCTLQIVPTGTKRPIYSRLTENVIATTTTSSWRGKVNFSEKICRELGISKNQIVE